MATLLAHYWRDDDPKHLIGAIARDWVRVLEGMPEDAIERACMRYLREEPRRKPTPGAIYAMAREAIPRPVVVARREAQDTDTRQPCSADRAQEIMREAGFAVRRFGAIHE